jgi:hypothetical protein
MPVNLLASEQIKATAAPSDKIIKLLNYCTMHPEAKVRYHVSDMILNINSDASYLSHRELKSRAEQGGGLLHGKQHRQRQKTHQWCDFDHQHDYQTWHVISSGSRNGSILLNAKEATVLCTTLEEMGHP